MLDGWDAAELQNFKLQDGTTYAQVVGMMNAALGALGSEIYSHPVWSSMVSYTDQPDTEYRTGATNGTNRYTEYSRPDPQRADTTGHMLPLLDWDRGLGWTWKYLRKARTSQIEADIADAIKSMRDRYRVQILTRLLQRGDDSGDTKGLGTGGYSPGFATTAASTNVDFTPPNFGGTSFASTHEHYVGITGGAHTAALFQDAKEELREHGHEPPFEYIAGPTEEVAIRALAGFVKTDDAYVSYGALQDRVNFSNMSVAPGFYPIGAYEDFRIWIVRGMPQYYGFGWKSYGQNSQMNPLRIRVDKNANAP
jgi:hypothetical protein